MSRSDEERIGDILRAAELACRIAAEGEQDYGLCASESTG